MEILYQDKPYKNCTYTQNKNRSFTDCLESYQNGAHKESMILRWNNRLPTKEMVLHFLKVFTAGEIKEILKVVFADLRKNGIEGVANIEFTTRGQYGKPNNTVHSHILTDDPRKITELKKILIKACEQHGLVCGKDFSITSQKEIPDPDGYIDYFTKYGYLHRVILFQPKTGINKFYSIGKWFEKGRGKGEIWNEIKAEMREKHPDSSVEAYDGQDRVPSTIHDEPSPKPTQTVYGKTKRTAYHDDIEVPFEYELNMEFERNYLREEYGINLDVVVGNDKSITEFYYPTIGKFRKFPNAGWLLVNEEVPRQSANSSGHKTTEAIEDRYIWLRYKQERIPVDKCCLNPTLDYYLEFPDLFPKRTFDRRGEPLILPVLDRRMSELDYVSGKLYESLSLNPPDVL